MQNPIEFRAQRTELQPDMALLRPRRDFYAARHPVPTDVLLLIEVADSTLRLDRRVKIPLYARTRVREAWLIDLVTEHVEVYRAPIRARYSRRETHGRGQALTPVAFPDIVVTVDDLLG